jgi:hypothetical protein
MGEKKPVVRIIRKNDHFGSMADLDVYINGCLAGQVKPNSHANFPVSIGEVRVYVKMDWCRSEEATFVLDEKNYFVPLDVESPQVPLFSAVFNSKAFFRLAASRSFEFQK